MFPLDRRALLNRLHSSYQWEWSLLSWLGPIVFSHLRWKLGSVVFFFCWFCLQLLGFEPIQEGFGGVLLGHLSEPLFFILFERCLKQRNLYFVMLTISCCSFLLLHLFLIGQNDDAAVDNLFSKRNERTLRSNFLLWPCNGLFSLFLLFDWPKIVTWPLSANEKA